MEGIIWMFYMSPGPNQGHKCLWRRKAEVTVSTEEGDDVTAGARDKSGFEDSMRKDRGQDTDLPEEVHSLQHLGFRPSKLTLYL
jgi:hypothetical protein